jgi:hypothetical protein
MVLYAEYPFRCARYIDQAINHMRIFDVEAVESMIQDDSIYYRHKGNTMERINKNGVLRLEREDVFKRSGGIQLINSGSIEKLKSMNDLILGHILIDEIAAYHVNTVLKIKMAQHLATEVKI